MSFIQNFRWSHCLLGCFGILALVISKFLPLATLFIPILAIAMREHPQLGARILKIPVALINTLTLIFFVYCVIFFLIRQEDLIAAGVYFTIYLQMVKILTANKNRDYFQILLLAFAHLIAATLLSNDVGFIIPFLLFLILAPWSFTLYNLKEQLEKAEAPDKVERVLKSSQVVGRRFFIITAIISLGLLLNTLAIFFLFPRVSFGYLFKRIRPGQAVSGFSDKVDLNHFGQIKNSETIVMRVESSHPRTKELLEELYWRGLVYDVYDSQLNKWRRTDDEKQKLNIDIFTGRFKLRENPPENLFVHTITLEPLETEVLFAADRLYEIQWDKMQLERMLRHDLSVLVDPYRSIYFNSNLVSDRLYTATSLIKRPDTEELRQDAISSNNNQDLITHYTQLPELSPRVIELAKEITKNTSNSFDRAQAIVTYLSTKLQYTLKVPAFEESPIEDFLFKSRRGHCEYFATSAVLLLRSVGVPARLVSGFRGGAWNEYGQYLTIRERDAHTWVEVWFPSFAWQRFDPTPPDLAANDFAQIRFAAFRKWFDYIELRWYRYFVNYDLQSQYQMAKGAWQKTSLSMQGIRKLGDGEGFWKNIWAALKQRDSEATDEPQPLVRFLVVLLILSGLLALFKPIMSLIKSKQSNSNKKADPIYQLYQLYNKQLKRRGWQRSNSQTPQEFIASLKPELQSPELIKFYYRCRFGKFRTPPIELIKLRNWLKQIEQQNH